MKFNRKLLKLIAWISFITYFTPETGYAASTTKKSRVLIATPVRQTPDILREFLGSLKRLEANSYTAEYLFFDDNDNQESKELLISFSKQHGIKCKISTLENEKKDGYLCNENGHHWSPQLTWRVAEIKDRMIEHARNHSYDYLFLIDSDLILNPLTVDCLIEKNKDIISNIFWSFWTPDSMFLPQVWMRDHYTQYEVAVGEYPSKEEIHLRHFQFLEKMRTPGTYKVGGLGACTLINKATLNKGISFKELKNCSYIGEDRHFCLRAAALDIDLFVDTHYPAYHIFRDSDLSDVENFKRSCTVTKEKALQKSPRLTLSMIMKNEGGHRLRQMLENAKRYITDAVIIDDASTDNSVAICEEVLKGIPHKIIKNKASKFHNEIDLRTQQWEETIKTNPDWIIILDADEIMEDSFATNVHKLISNPGIDAFYCRLFDFWDEDHYREDPYWNAHQKHWPVLIRYRPEIPHVWSKQTAQHCGRMPPSCTRMVGVLCDYRIKHFGWSNPKLRQVKYQRYSKLDPNAKHGIKEQYDSILDPSPTLVKWIESSPENGSIH